SDPNPPLANQKPALSRLLAHRHELALGIEKIGLVSMHFPVLTACIAIMLAIAAGFGVSRVRGDGSLSQLFLSGTAGVQQYEEEARRFPSSEFDVLLVIEGNTLLEREQIEKVRDFVTDLQLISGTRGIISYFSARQAPEEGRLPAPLVPDQLPEGEAFQDL